MQSLEDFPSVVFDFGELLLAVPFVDIILRCPSLFTTLDDCSNAAKRERDSSKPSVEPKTRKRTTYIKRSPTRTRIPPTQTPIAIPTISVVVMPIGGDIVVERVSFDHAMEEV